MATAGFAGGRRILAALRDAFVMPPYEAGAQRQDSKRYAEQNRGPS
jgi:hypothetical protein